MRGLPRLSGRELGEIYCSGGTWGMSLHVCVQTVNIPDGEKEKVGGEEGLNWGVTKDGTWYTSNTDYCAS